MKKNTTPSIYSLAFAGLFFLSSCGTIYYAPNQPNLPMVKDRGVTKINGAVGGGELSTAFDLNVFHSVSNSVGIMGNFTSMYMPGSVINSVDLGAGYFSAFDENSGFTTEGFRFGSCLKSSDGELLWGSRSGINYFFSDQLINRPADLKVLVYKADMPD